MEKHSQVSLTEKELSVLTKIAEAAVMDHSIPLSDTNILDASSARALETAWKKLQQA